PAARSVSPPSESPAGGSGPAPKSERRSGTAPAPPPRPLDRTDAAAASPLRSVAVVLGRAIGESALIDLHVPPRPRRRLLDVQHVPRQRLIHRRPRQQHEDHIPRAIDRPRRPRQQCAVRIPQANLAEIILFAPIRLRYQAKLVRALHKRLK